MQVHHQVFKTVKMLLMGIYLKMYSMLMFILKWKVSHCLAAIVQKSPDFHFKEMTVW